MKFIKFSRQQILRAVRAACIALFLAACAGNSVAAPTNSAEFMVNGSTVTVLGTAHNPTTASFFDPSPNAYAFTIQSPAVIGNTSVDLISFDNGSVNNAGTLASSDYAIVIHSTTLSSTVTNSGSISSTGSTAVQINGDGTVNNTGTISGYDYGVDIRGAGGASSVTNSGTITGSGSSNYGGGVGFGGTGVGASSFTLMNSGTITGSATYSGSVSGYGVNAKSFDGNISITNAAGGSISGTASGYYAKGYGIYAASISGAITLTNNGTVTGTGIGGSSGSDSGYGYGIYATSSSGAITLTNSGTATGTGSGYYRGTGSGIYASNFGAITLTNSGTATGTGTATSTSNGSTGTGFGIYTSSDYGAITLTNRGKAIGSGSGYYRGTGYGIYAHSTSGNITINNTGTTTGSGSYSGYGIFVNAGSGTITLTNAVSGLIQGSGQSTSVGIELASGTGPATLTNSGTVSAYYGVGIHATGYSGPITINEIGGAVTTGALTTTGSGTYSGLYDAIHLGSGTNTVNIVGQANNTGLIDGGSSGSNTLSMHLAGMTPAQAAALQAAVVATAGGGASGPVFAGGVTYSWIDFQNVSGTFVSLELAVDPGLHDIATRIDNLTTYPGVAYGPFYTAAAGNPESALNSLVGREFDDALGIISKNDATALSDVFDSRAFDLRSGTGGFDLSGLNVMPGSTIASLGATQNTLARLMGTSALGGTTMSDSKEVLTTQSPRRWGAWASGTVTLADESTTATGPGFNATTGSPTLGADYRVNDHIAVGALINYSTTGANFADGSRLGVQTGVLALYSTWSDGPWYVNGLVGGGYSSYDNRRTTLSGETANSHPDGDEVLANLTGGYDFKLGGGWKISPEGGLLYTHVTQNGYTESGADAFDLTLAEQNIDSLRSKLGFTVIDNFTWDGIAFTPQFRANWYHEILDDSRGVTTGLPGAPALGSFVVQTNAEGRDFAIVGAGLSATPAELHGDVTFFVNYDAQVGQANYIGHTVNGGIRVNF